MSLAGPLSLNSHDSPPWQICKLFGAFLISAEITSLKHDRHLLKAQKDALRTLNTLSAELKWPTSSIRGVSLPSSADKVRA